MSFRSFKTSKFSIYFSFSEIISCVSNSAAEPKEIYKNCISYFLEFRAEPSATLEGIETATLLI
jgi:hypothetical protein